MTTGSRCRTSVSTSISEKPAAPSPSSSTTCADGRARRAAMAAPSPAPRQPYGPGSSHPPGRRGSTYLPAELEESAPPPGPPGLDLLPGKPAKFPAVADAHGVIGEPGHELAVDARGVDGVGL